MQSKTSEKSSLAVARLGLRKTLDDLANVNTLTEGHEFLKAHGPLDTKRTAGEIVVWAEAFRMAWKAKAQPKLIPSVNALLADVFTRTNYFYGEGPVLAADFATGKWEPEPRTLLDALAVELVRSRKMLHRCERPECRKYFVKERPRDRYCETPSRPTCGEVMRARSVKKYQQNHREEINARRRKPRKKRPQRNAA